MIGVRALQEGEAVPVIALTGLASNLTNIAGGLLVFGDPLAHGAGAIVGQSAAFALVVCGGVLMPNPAAALTDGPPRLADRARRLGRARPRPGACRRRRRT